MHSTYQLMLSFKSKHCKNAYFRIKLNINIEPAYKHIVKVLPSERAY